MSATVGVNVDTFAIRAVLSAQSTEYRFKFRVIPGAGYPVSIKHQLYFRSEFFLDRFLWLLHKTPICMCVYPQHRELLQ